MYGVEVKICHLLHQTCCWRAAGHSHTDGLRESLSFFSVAEESVNRRCCIKVCDVLCFQQTPDFRVVDFAEAVVGPTYDRNGPWESPACKTQ